MVLVEQSIQGQPVELILRYDEYRLIAYLNWDMLLTYFLII